MTKADKKITTILEKTNKKSCNWNKNMVKYISTKANLPGDERRQSYIPDGHGYRSVFLSYEITVSKGSK